MKKRWSILFIGILFCSCNQGNYRLSDYEKGKLRGYHANEANRLIEVNKKNKKANQKAAEKHRLEEAERLRELNRSENDKKKNSGERRQSYNMY